MKKEINNEEDKEIHKVERFVHLWDELGVPLW
jgi:hypothetical protein